MLTAMLLVMQAIDAAAHQTMSTQALNSETVRVRLLTVLLGPGELWEGLRADGGTPSPPPAGV